MNLRDLHEELNHLGFARVGKTTYQGKILELTYFDRAGTKIEIDFKNSADQPDNTVEEFWF